MANRLTAEFSIFVRTNGGIDPERYGSVARFFPEVSQFCIDRGR